MVKCVTLGLALKVKFFYMFITKSLLKMAIDSWGEGGGVKMCH